MIKSKTEIFLFRQMLYLPIMILIVLVFMLMLPKGTFPTEKLFSTSHFFADYLFFNTLHVIIPFLFILIIPEYKEWAGIKGISGPFKYWQNTLIISTFFFIMVLLGSSVMESLAINSNWFYFAYIIRIILRGFHSVGQSIGLSMTFNADYLKDSRNENKKLINLRSFEKVLTWSLVLVMLVLFTLNFRGNPLRFMLNPGRDYFIASFIYLNVLITLILMLYPLLYPKELRWIKFLFHLRFAFFSLQFLTPFALIGIWCAHGTEYLYITNRILSKKSLEIRKYFWKMFLIVGSIWGIAVIFRSIDYYNFERKWLIIYLAIIWTVDLTHYWTDRVLFKMKNKETRELIGPSLA